MAQYNNVLVADCSWQLTSAVRDVQPDTSHAYERIESRLRVHRAALRRCLSRKPSMRCQLDLLRIVAILSTLLVAMKRRCKVPDIGRTLPNMAGTCDDPTQDIRPLRCGQCRTVTWLIGVCFLIVCLLYAATKASRRSYECASPCLIFHLRRSDHVTDALVSLHWLRVPERIQFKIAVLTYRVLHSDAPRYIRSFTSTADVPGRRALRSAGTNRLVVPPVRLSTVGSRAFPVAATHIWNSLSEHIVSRPTLQSFRLYLKRFLLQQSFCL